MDLATVLRWAADRYPHRRAVGGTRPMTYAQWDAHTNQLARALAGLGVCPGDHVVLSLSGGERHASLHTWPRRSWAQCRYRSPSG